MTALSKFLAGGAAVAALVSAVPAAAQYGGYNNGYNNGGAGVVGQIINSVLGYGQYPYGNYGYGDQRYSNSQRAVNQCARAAEARIGNGYNNGYGNNGYTGYNGYANGYANNGYTNGYPNNAFNGGGNTGARVLGINSVEIKGYNRIKVVGVASSGRNYANPYGYGGYSYNRNYGVPDLKFVCDADQSGRVYNVRIKANDGRR